MEEAEPRQLGNVLAELSAWEEWDQREELEEETLTYMWKPRLLLLLCQGLPKCMETVRVKRK